MHLLHTTLLLAIAAAPFAIASKPTAFDFRAKDQAQAPKPTKPTDFDFYLRSADQAFIAEVHEIVNYAKTAKTAGTPAELHKFECTHRTEPDPPNKDIQHLDCVFSTSPGVPEVAAIIDELRKANIFLNLGILFNRGEMCKYDTTLKIFGHAQWASKRWGGWSEDTEVTGHLGDWGQFFGEINFVYRKE